MNRYFGLMTQIAQELGIRQGDTEKEDVYKARLVYSLLGRMAMASLRDTADDEETISIAHFKQRIGSVLNSYLDMYPELWQLFLQDWTALENEIYGVCLATGQMYHSPNRLLPACRSSCTQGEVRFLRGTATGFPCQVSGLGCYQCGAKQDGPDRSPRRMLGLPESSMAERWAALLKRCRWDKIRLDSQAEYLRMQPPFTRGYWQNRPEKGQRTVSLMRTGQPGGYTYYLYKQENGQYSYAQLPAWQTEKHAYREVSNCCLNAQGSLPELLYWQDGELVHITQQYLLPPAELNFIKLYSWPDSFIELPHDFNRTMDKKVFFAVKELLEASGYHWREVGNHGRS